MPLRLLICCCLLCALPVQALTIAMVLWRGETDAERGFLDELNRLGHHPTFVTFNANQDRTVLATLLRQQLLPSLADYDYIYCFGTTATAMVKSLVGNRKPLIFSIVSDPSGPDSCPTTRRKTRWWPAPATWCRWRCSSPTPAAICPPARVAAAVQPARAEHPADR